MASEVEIWFGRLSKCGLKGDGCDLGDSAQTLNFENIELFLVSMEN